MRTFRWVAVGAALSLLTALPVAAGHDESLHSDNIEEIARGPIKVPGGGVADGSDLAFEGDVIVAGSYSGTALFKILKRAPYVRQVGFHNCAGGQGDVNVYRDLVFVSLDSPQSSGSVGCPESAGMEGVRIVDVSDPSNPEQVNFVETDCGSHTNVVNPRGDKVYVYVMSYPLGVPSASCNVASHRKVSIIEVDVDAPAKAKVVGTLDVSPEIGCHDVTIMPDGKHAAAACIGESQIWDVSDPAQPVILSRIVNPAIEIHHGAGVTWDQKYLAIADEFAGSVTGECAGDRNSPVGALWFYDISNRLVPVPKSHLQISHPRPAGYCSAHQASLVPRRDDR
ncbi:MAG: LVIVD repeat-containing protein, partial [Actinomycetota bacterium]